MRPRQASFPDSQSENTGSTPVGGNGVLSDYVSDITKAMRQVPSSARTGGRPLGVPSDTCLCSLPNIRADYKMEAWKECSKQKMTAFLRRARLLPLSALLRAVFGN